MIKNISANLIVELIQKVTGKGSHQLHEPLFFGKENWRGSTNKWSAHWFIWRPDFVL